MATDVDVQYFSHLNGLTLGNNWGDLIRLLDKALVTGLDFTQITAASIDAQGDVHITLYSAHNAMLFQVVELSGFTPSSLNQKYRIKGVPNTTQLILKPAIDIAERSITTIGAGKLASLGYDIIFRDIGDVKRVYRAKNPSVQHPFIRVDESLASDTGTYTSTYAKFAMVGLLEHMDHVDDYQNPNVLQLPFDPADPAKNWKITGTGTAVVRGWSRWYWAKSGAGTNNASADSAAPTAGGREFTLCGSKDVFYFTRNVGTTTQAKILSGCGLTIDALEDNTIPNWFLMTTLLANAASASFSFQSSQGGMPLCASDSAAQFFSTNYNLVNRLSSQVACNAILPDLRTGSSNLYGNSDVAGLEIAFADESFKLRGNLNHIAYAAKSIITTSTAVALAKASMYVMDSLQVTTGSYGGVYFYLGEIE